MTGKSQSSHAEESFKSFRWDKEEKINNLIQCMLNCKSETEFEWKYFNADKVKLYESVRQKMEKTYVPELSSFGPPNLERYAFMERDDNSLDEIELEEITVGYMIEKYIKT